MTKKEFIQEYATRNNLTNAEAKRRVEGFTDLISEMTKSKGKLSFVGWASFEEVEKPARKGRNPKTGEEIDIPAKKAIKIKAGNKF